MKNIHVLPTDKPSRLLKNTQYNSFWLRTDFLDREIKRGVEKLQYQNIYITSDEEIKDKTWVLDKTNNRIVFLLSLRKDSYNKNVNFSEKYYKIILTTDQDLIKDGVQDIPDEFLEWFVKNPSCEFVEIKRQMRLLIGKTLFDYKIVIPKEEPKPFKDMQKLTEVDWEKFKKKPFISKKEDKQEVGKEFYESADKTITIYRQETLEEAAKKFYPPATTDLICSPKLVRDAFVAGAKWQSERMHSDEEVIKIAKLSYNKARVSTGNLEVNFNIWFDTWFEQFKKK
jgi:hypothetical protein